MKNDLRYGIIGTGMMGQEHLRNIGEIAGIKVEALADPNKGSLEQAQKMLSEPVATFTNHLNLLDANICDAVVVVSPNDTHFEILKDVIDRRVPVLVEKPLCTTVADASFVRDQATKAKSLVWVGLEYRYMPAVAQLVSAVKSGAVGKVRMVAFREHRFPFLQKVNNWNRFNRNTGGTLVEKCCHFFDLMNLIIGSEPIRIMASGAQDVNHKDEIYSGAVPDIIDNAFVIVEYKNGSRASLDLCMFAEGSKNQEEITVTGDKGKIEAFLPSNEVRIGTRSGGSRSVKSEVVVDSRIAHQGFHHGSSYLEHLGFLSAIRGEGPVEVGVDAGWLSVVMGVAAQTSIHENRAVAINEVI